PLLGRPRLREYLALGTHGQRLADRRTGQRQSRRHARTPRDAGAPGRAVVSGFAQSYGPWAVVAGASDGTGAAFAEDLASRGVNVVLVARRRNLLEELAARLPTETRVVAMDLSVPEAGAQLVAAVADIDVGLLVYNAGADDHSTPFLEQPIDDLRS